LSFIEYLTFLREKYNANNTEILEELRVNNIDITKSYLSHKLKGERKITPEELTVIIDVIRPSVAETNKLMELYNIVQFGEDRFQEVMYIKEYIEDLSDETVIHFEAEIDSLDNISVIDNEKTLGNVLYHLLDKSWGKETIKVFCQPDFRKLIDEFIFFSQRSPSDIEYLVCVNNDYKSDSNLYNINLLRYLGKIFKHNYMLNVRYFYDKINSRANDFSIFPYFIAFGDKLLMIDHNFKTGYLSSDPKYNEIVIARFNYMFENSKRLFEVIDDVAEYMQLCTRLELSCKKKFYTLQFHPCVLFTGEKRLTDDHIKDSFELKDTLVSNIGARAANKKITGYNLHSANGTKDFIETGETCDMSPLYSIPFSEAERKEVLQRIRKSKNHVDVELTSDFITLPKDIFIGCYDTGSVIISYKSKLNENSRFIINERGLYKSLYNFFEYMMNFMGQ